MAEPSLQPMNLKNNLFLTVKSQPSDNVKPDFLTDTFPMCISKEEKSLHFFKQINEWTNKWWPVFSSQAKHSMFPNKQRTHGVKWRWGIFDEATLGRKANTGQRAVSTEGGQKEKGEAKWKVTEYSSGLGFAGNGFIQCFKWIMVCSCFLCTQSFIFIPIMLFLHDAPLPPGSSPQDPNYDLPQPSFFLLSLSFPYEKFLLHNLPLTSLLITQTLISCFHLSLSFLRLCQESSRNVWWLRDVKTRGLTRLNRIPRTVLFKELSD